MTLLLRDATEADIPAITAIYAVEVTDFVNTYEYEVPDEAEMAQRRRNLLAAGYPYLVAELEGRVVGYAYAGSYRARIAYQWTVENSVYVAAEAQGKGVGAALMQRLIDECQARGYRQMVAVIGEPTNLASIRLHERFGFELVGIFKGLGRKHGRWLDTVQMQRAIGPGTGQPPIEEVK
ncbi:MAG TPA: GNAT family N-acetyltransferase [Stenotrophomonas sp.]|nr:GNAT family N-acetyltransferase [Stenotrophomonas sp.]